MQASSLAPDLAPFDRTVAGDAHASGVSWGAVFAGGAAAAALSFILLILGVGLGLSSISPYSYHSAAMSDATIAWLAFMQLAASGIGGYMAGRLRVKWPHVHGDEVHFRDTAHGLLAWSLATLVTVALLAGAARAVLSGAIDAAAAVGAPAAALVAGANPAIPAGASGNPSEYFSDLLLRSGGADGVDNGRRAEVKQILLNNLAVGALSAEDRSYLARLVATRAGLSQADAERRVDDMYARASKATDGARAKAKEVAEQARKAAMHSALWMFIALLLGAFVASLSATFGGARRDATPRPAI
ncbi:hypothetical protein AAKU55_000420 [Oxalobacteraceae bacterium GrIS 1.11]